MNDLSTKLYAVGAAGALTTIIVWAVHQWGKVDIPPEVATALTTVISVATGYLTPRTEKEVIEIAQHAEVTGVYPANQELKDAQAEVGTH